MRRKWKTGLRELNFLDVCFEVRLTRMEVMYRKGMGKGRVLDYTESGRRITPPFQSGIGGELSRVMLAIKAVMADKEETPTLIFDEIDTGISGITAAKVAKQMEIIGSVPSGDLYYPFASDRSSGRQPLSDRKICGK